MIIELLILIFLLWIYSGGFNSQPRPEDEIIAHLERDLNNLFMEDAYRPKYRLFISHDRTYVTNKTNIHLVIRHPDKGYFFDHKTLLRVSIHELAHVLSPEMDHSSLFFSIEDLLIARAVEKNLLPEDFTPDVDYPCHPY